MGGGILPVALHNNTIYFLFSREYIHSKDKGGLWSDFGGSREGNETYKETAVREGFEESSGILGSKKNIENLINNYTLKTITVNGFREYLVIINYDPLLPKRFREYFLKVKRDHPNMINKNGYFEKDKLAWVSINNLDKFQKNFRPWYKNIIKKI